MSMSTFKEFAAECYLSDLTIFFKSQEMQRCQSGVGTPKEVAKMKGKRKCSNLHFHLLCSLRIAVLYNVLIKV